MSKNNNDFFQEKKEWSKIKDSLLCGYLPEYFSKVLWTKKPIVYVDCFSGKGKFLDGEDGSPRMALKAIQSALNTSKSTNKAIKTYFIEAEYSNELETNLSDFQSALDISVIEGKYEKEIENILKESVDNNVFLYIDPYGIKTLDFDFFKNFSELKSVEFLLNLNSFGFLRAGFSALAIPTYYCNFDDNELVSIESNINIESNDELAARLDKVAGGNYWRQIIRDCQNKKLSTYDAEKEFTKQYISNLQKHFKYVLNMPIKLKSSSQPKYRMIHVSNHVDGCYLMAENISRQTDKLVLEIQNKGQPSLFEESIENEIIDITDIKRKVVNEINCETHLKQIVADFFNKFGMICKVKDLIESLKSLEKDNKIIVKRTPAFTLNGKQTSFWSEEKNKQILIARK